LFFKISDEELDDLRTKFSTANISSKSRYNPHVVNGWTKLVAEKTLTV